MDPACICTPGLKVILSRAVILFGRLGEKESRGVGPGGELGGEPPAAGSRCGAPGKILGNWDIFDALTAILINDS